MYRICCLGIVTIAIVVIRNSDVMRYINFYILFSSFVNYIAIFEVFTLVFAAIVVEVFTFIVKYLVFFIIYSAVYILLIVMLSALLMHSLLFPLLLFVLLYSFLNIHIIPIAISFHSSLHSLSFSVTAVVFNNHVVMYVSWLGINVNNIYGFFLFMLFVVQIITGILLSFYYSSSSYISFESVYYLSFNVLYGFIIRFIHVIGSFLCIYFLYMHLLRSLWYTINFQLTSTFLYTYSSGLVILFLSLLVSFLGYCLWGQMSYWGIQVLINILTILPSPFSYILPELIYSSSLQILYRFFVLHFLLSLIILLLIVFHLFVLHSFISSNTFINLSSSLFISFYLFIFKDFYYFFIFYFLFLTFIFFYNFEFLSNPVNLIHASSLSTPLHILPESYYLIFYSLLRALPSKLFGIIVVLIFMFYLLFYNFSTI